MKTQQKSTFIKSIVILFILIFAFIPLAEITTHLEYNTISYYAKQTICAMDYPFEVLSFKEIK
ncbi:hypothetical protein [Polaribacter aestuariivivens]|uniref:hypothetical protein n=1 Tax=Polaribacter aestuariivivens TaxID=2304626 RepID=UPI003F49AD57